MKKIILLASVVLIFSASFILYFRYVKAQDAVSGQNGLVEVVIGLKIEARTESGLTPTELEQQRAKIDQAQKDLLARLKDFRIEVTRQFKHIPYLIAKVDADALRFLQNENFTVQKAEPISLTANRASTISDENKLGNLTSIIDSGVDRAKTGRTKSYRAKANALRKMPGAPPKKEGGKKFFPAYSRENEPGENAVAPNPPTAIDDSLLPEKKTVENPSISPGDMDVFSSHNVTEAPVNSRSNVSEPSVVNIGDGVFYTANFYAARSLDGGQSFTYINPGTTFPAANGGFCCDQVTAYAPAQDMILWGLQYDRDSSASTFRIARTIGVSGLANNEWIYWNFTPQSFGLQSGLWMDFPSMSVGSSYLYVTSNIFNASGFYRGCVVWRVSLAELASGGSINYSHLVYPPSSQSTPHIISLRLIEGAGATMHWVHLPIDTPTTVRISHWADGSEQITFQETAVNPFNTLFRNGFAFSPDGTNWVGFGDSRVLAGYVSNGVVGAMWGARQGGEFPYPYTIHARFNENTGALIYQGAIWSENFAWLYPTASVNAAGNLGGAISYGGGGTVAPFPNTAFWAIDDISNTLPLGASFAAATSNAGPAANRWGDYLTVKPHKQYPNTWAAAMFYMNGGTSNANTVSRYLWFGRERDGPASIAAPFDFDGDGKTDISIFRPSVGEWWYLKSSDGGNSAAQFGNSADLITPGDFTGDGKTDIAFWRPSTGFWFVLRSEDFSFFSFPYGTNGDVPATGDYDNDGKADAAVFRPSNSTWFIRRWTDGGSTIQQFGQPGDVPAAADYDGDGKTDIAIYRPSSGEWWLNRSTAGVLAFQFGNSSDKCTPGDYTGDGKADVAFWRPSTGEWFILRSEDQSYYSFPYGLSGDMPAPGDYDGDGKYDTAVFRTSNITWFIRRSGDGGSTIQGFGQAGDRAVPNAYVVP